jgi:hypothetical protein
MALRVDVRVDADGDAGWAPDPCGDRLDAIQLSGRFDVDRLQPEWDGAFELGGRLADASEDNVGRSKTGAPGDIDLSDRIGIHAAAESPQCLHDPEGRIGLERVVQPVRVIGEREVDLAVAIADGRCAVDVYGRTFGAAIADTDTPSHTSSLLWRKKPVATLGD